MFPALFYSFSSFPLRSGIFSFLWLFVLLGTFSYLTQSISSPFIFFVLLFDILSFFAFPSTLSGSRRLFHPTVFMPLFLHRSLSYLLLLNLSTLNPLSYGLTSATDLLYGAMFDLPSLSYLFYMPERFGCPFQSACLFVLPSARDSAHVSHPGFFFFHYIPSVLPPEDNVRFWLMCGPHPHSFYCPSNINLHVV